jgi:hypothetical protein
VLDLTLKHSKTQAKNFLRTLKLFFLSYPALHSSFSLSSAQHISGRNQPLRVQTSEEEKVQTSEQCCHPGIP